jgi:hypothetical protein
MADDDTPLSDDALLATLAALERELLDPATRADRGRVDALLDDAFVEVGRSGARYSKADLLARLPAQSVHPQTRADGFALRRLGPDAALLTWRSAWTLPDGALERHTLRASVWQRSPEGWRLAYHQGTAAEATWGPVDPAAPGG